jgi:hypothetical protein
MIYKLSFIILAYGFNSIAELYKDLGFKSFKNIFTVSLILKVYYPQDLYKVVKYYKNKAIILL